MKLLFIFMLSGLCAFGFAQSGQVTLGKAMPIDIHVIEAEWQPQGQALIYKREEDSGFSLGIYGVGHREGKAVIPIQKEGT